MATITTRAGKGAPLSWTEADANFINLNNDKVETSILANYSTTVETDASIVSALADHINDTIDAHVSSAIGYLPAGTGAVATDVQTKLREFVSVKDFGAVGDGVIDDTAAIQAAINSGAKLVGSPAGATYRITDTITIDLNSVAIDLNNSELLLDDAAGVKSHIKLGNGTTQRSGIKVRNIVFTRQQVATDGYAIDSDFIGVCEITGCRIYGNNEIWRGIRIYRGIVVGIHNNYIDNCINRGLYIEGSGTGANRTVDVVIRENRIEGSVTAIETWDFVEGVFCRDNIFFNTSGAAVSVNASTNANGLVSFKFQENDFDTCGGSGLYLDKVSNVQVTGCWFSSITPDALQLKSDCQSVLVSGNQFYPTAAGVRIECPDVRIDNNLISGGTTCVNIAGGTRVGINGNTLQNAGVGVNIGSATNIHITGNLLSSISTAAYQNVNSTTSIQNNRGDGYAGTSAFISVGASPYTYTAGVTAEYISVFNGTVSNIQIGSNSIGFGTNRTVVLAPNQSVTVTYSSVPFMVKNLL